MCVGERERNGEGWREREREGEKNRERKAAKEGKEKFVVCCVYVLTRRCRMVHFQPRAKE